MSLSEAVEVALGALREKRSALGPEAELFWLGGNNPEVSQAWQTYLKLGAAISALELLGERQTVAHNDMTIRTCETLPKRGVDF